MLLVFLNLVFMLVILNSNAARINEEINNYFKHPDRGLLQATWQKYKRGFETTLEQMLQENYDGQGVNIFKRRVNDFYELTEGFMTVGDPELSVIFRNLYLMELPKMRSPKVLFTLGSNLLKVDAELLNVKVLAKYIVYRNDTATVYASHSDMNRVSPFSLHQVHPTGEVTIIGEECRLTGHAIATLSDQSVNLGHNTFGLTDCKFNLEIYTPGENTPPVFARYFNDCDRNFLQNLISKPLQEELVSKLQGGIFSYVNTSEIFGEDLPVYRARQIDQFKNVNKYMTSVITNLNARAALKTSGIDDLHMKVIGWTETLGTETHKKTVAISNVTLYGLDTAYSAHTGGPIELHGQIYVEDTIGYNTLLVQGRLIYQNFLSPDAPPKEVINKFSAEIHDLTVVTRIAVGDDGLKAANADSVNKDKRSWFAPRIRNFELNLFEISEIWARSFVTSFLNTEIYTAVIGSLLSGQLNIALKATADGAEESVVPHTDNSRKLKQPDSSAEISEERKTIESIADAKDGDGHPDLDESKQVSDEERMVLWRTKKSEDVVLSLSKDKVRVHKGDDILFEANRESENEVNTN
ncbi:uncharacterized protein LOC128674958 [Plodia interpunctella]|uniref:uncharacterized protein LOC128674958 n=1 Tax=Plodia interpunctella TaxID=58824 RepID=UPI002368BC04|nr:uncharacterized protein LOC128674958 [Plodia interpunctella]